MPRSPRLRLRGATAALVAATALIAAAGCSRNESASGDGKDGGSGKHYTVAYVPGVTQNSYFDTVKRAMDDVAKANTVTLDHQGSPNFNVADQTKVLNAVYAQRPDLLIVAPVDPVAMRAPIQRFLSAGIPVITVDQVLKNSAGIVSSIYGDGKQGGALAGAQMAKLSGGDGTVAIINVVAGVTALEDRVDGFKEALQKAAPNVKIAPVQEAGSNPSGSEAATRSLLLAYPDLKGIYGVTEVNAEGAAAALRAQNKSGKIPVIAYDGTPLEVQYLKQGLLQYLVVQQARKAGEIAMQHAVDYLNGDKSKIQKQVTLPTVGVDMSNLDKPEIQNVLYGPAIS
ncbi:substrate-binding domain-containing protein [Kribbella sp. NPDC050124]|uniref:substrate-binding domain-containing protein n=1 Tax=Kribbella sp. NPDC050124 TaxID=3364114 RepID=UPI0037993D1F